MAYTFDPELQPLVDMLGALPERDFSDVEGTRAGLKALIEPLNASVDTSDLVIEDREVSASPPVAVRVYAPDSPAPPGGRPALLDIHGGGSVCGDMALEHGFSALAARAPHAAVAAVEHRRAPEHPLP